MFATFDTLEVAVKRTMLAAKLTGGVEYAALQDRVGPSARLQVTRDKDPLLFPRV